MVREARATRNAPTRTRLRLNTNTRNRGTITDEGGEPPHKRRRYVPGGPGGGGRWQAADGSEVLVGGTGPGGYNYLGPRGRIGPANAAAFSANGEPIPPSAPPPRASRVAAAASIEKTPKPRREYSRRDRTSTRPRYPSAAAAAAAVVQGDGFKPREERGWEEFHQDLDVEADICFFTADEVDGNVRTPVAATAAEATSVGPGEVQDVGSVTATPVVTPQPRRRGRPPRKGDSLLKGIGTPNTPKVVPLPGPNPRERLTLPKPSCREHNPFLHYEITASQTDYVDKSMSSVGYQQSDEFIRPDLKYLRLEEGTIEEELDLPPAPKSEGQSNAAIGSTGVGRVEYDMDEQDQQWLEAYNVHRKTDGVDAIKPAIFEITMSKIEKEWHALEKRIPKPNPKAPQTHRPRSSSAAAVNGEQQGEEQDIKCAVCDDGDCENTNAIVFCDGCNLAVHQECYGVPYIPEGQWHCRRCGLIGRGIPTCIFCPNTDGAFKQATSGIWAHLLCSIWIPEVTIGNPSFMEPVMDVETVPKQRWKLACYICKQKMGACIQCGNKNCFEAFHVTCARRAKLFLQMKSTHGGVSQLLDASVLKAFCHRHVPNEWRKEQNSDRAVQEAMQYYRLAMRGRKWADSQQAALNGVSHHNRDIIAQSIEAAPTPRLTLTMGGKRAKKVEPAKKNVWRLPSGAPIIPAVLYNSVEASLQRFTVRKRKEFAAEMCRYWTLKREAKRGAALIKRLQLQMESFSSMEVTRRDFAAMGAVGRPRLHCRLDFAEQRLEEVGQLAELAGRVKEREEMKLDDNDYLTNLINTVYFPISALLQPIIERAEQLDIRDCFADGLARLNTRNAEFLYTSVKQFSSDLSIVLSSAVGMSAAVSDTAEVHAQLDKDRGRKDLSAEQKEKRKLAKRIIKGVQPALEDALRKESEMEGREYEELLKDLDAILETSVSSRRDSVSSSSDAEDKPMVNGVTSAAVEEEEKRTEETAFETIEAELEHNAENADEDAIMVDAVSELPKPQLSTQAPTPDDSGPDGVAPTAPSFTALPTSVPDGSAAMDETTAESMASVIQQGPATPSGTAPLQTTSGLLATQDDQMQILQHPQHPHPHPAPPTPPPSASAELQPPLPHGGLPWHSTSFDPEGTTFFEERWVTRRAMSEELSEMSASEFPLDMDHEMSKEMSTPATNGDSKARNSTVPAGANASGTLSETPVLNGGGGRTRSSRAATAASAAAAAAAAAAVAATSSGNKAGNAEDDADEEEDGDEEDVEEAAAPQQQQQQQQQKKKKAAAKPRRRRR